MKGELRNRRKFPCDPRSPSVCMPAQPVIFERPPPEPIVLAREVLTSPETLRHRRREFPELCKRRRRSEFGGMMVTYQLVRRPRYDFRAAQQRVAAACVERCDLRSGVVGEFAPAVEIAGKMSRPRFLKPLSRHQLAAKAGITVGQLDDVVSSFKGGEVIGRRQRRREILDHRGKVIGYTGDWATLVLNENFWRALGPRVWNALVKHRELLKLEGPARHPKEVTEESTATPATPAPWEGTTPAERGWPPEDDPPPTS